MKEVLYYIGDTRIYWYVIVYNIQFKMNMKYAYLLPLINCVNNCELEDWLPAAGCCAYCCPCGCC